MNAVPDPALWADAFALYSVGIAKRAAAGVAPCDQQIVNDHPVMRKAEVITRSDQRAEVALSEPKRIPHPLFFRNAAHLSGLLAKAIVEVGNHPFDFVSATNSFERINNVHPARNLGENLSADFLVGSKHLPISGAAGCRCGIGCHRL
tara:strand:- start:740 stop:1183 length:444 start_codon:yes stop_codon:yes gene_type:complete